MYDSGPSHPTLTNVLFTGNSATRGGAMYNSGVDGPSSPVLVNVTFAGNSAGGQGGAMYNVSIGGGSSPTLTNVILWGNTAGSGPQIYNAGATPVLRYTLIEGGCAGISENFGSSTDCGDGSTILTTDPLFADPAGDDYRLTAASPALNAGDNAALPAGVTTDLADNPRIFENDDPALRIVDLGAYEFQSEPEICPPGAIVYVDGDAAGANDGTSWADAHNDLKDASDTASRCPVVDEAWVAEGAYTPDRGTGSRDSSFVLHSSLAFYGGFAGTETQRSERDWWVHETILSGDIGTVGDSLDNSYHVVYARSVDSTAVFDGFTVTGGNAAGGTFVTARGGGFYCGGAGAGNFCNPTIRNILFTGNSASQSGGAMFNYGGLEGESRPVLTNVLFIDNTAFDYGGAMFNYGFNGESSPVLTNVTFAGNFASGGGGAMYNDGFNGESRPVLTNVILWGNDATNGGDQIGNANNATSVLRHTLVEGGCAADWDCGDGSTILTADPRFVDPAAGDYRLQGPGASGGRSPAIDAGTPDTTGRGLPAFDLAGEARVTAVIGTEAVIDLGAYESTGAPLPIELAAFNASVEGQAVVLLWKTLSEKGSASFEVQRATGAVETRDLASLQWQTIATVEAAGTTTEAQTYTYRVEALDYGTYTFRLRQEDLDGTTETLGEVEAIVALAEPYAISKVYPNPSSGPATVEVAVREAQHVRVEVYDVLGRRVATPFDEELSASDTRQVRLDGSRLSSGVYFVRVVGLPVRGTQTGEDFSETRRLVVAR